MIHIHLGPISETNVNLDNENFSDSHRHFIGLGAHKIRNMWWLIFPRGSRWNKNCVEKLKDCIYCKYSQAPIYYLLLHHSSCKEFFWKWNLRSKTLVQNVSRWTNNLSFSAVSDKSAFVRKYQIFNVDFVIVTNLGVWRLKNTHYHH